MSGESPTSVHSDPTDVREAALRVQVGDGAAGPRDCEPSPDFSEGRARAMYDCIAAHIEDVRTSLCMEISDSFYNRCMEDLRSLREGRFERVAQSLENLHALVDQLQSRLVLVEDARIDSLADEVVGRPASANSGVRRDPQPFKSAEQMGAFAHMAAEPNSTRRRAREVEQTLAERSPVAPPRAPGATVPPGTPALQEWPPTAAVPSRRAEVNIPTADANFASETQALPHVAGSLRQVRRVPNEDDPSRGGAARGSGETILPFDPHWGGYQPVDITTHPGPVDVRTLPVTPFGTLGPAEPGLEPVHTMIQEFSAVANYRMYQLDNTSRLVTSGDAGRIAKYVQRCRGLRATMKSFEGTDAIQVFPFLKDFRITLNAQHLTEGVAIRVFAHFLERHAERLYTSYAMRRLRAGQLHDGMSWLGLVNQFIKRYLTDDVLGEAFDAIASARQLPHETENTFADWVESAAFRCTAVFSEQALAHYSVRGLSTATRAAVAEMVQRLPGQQKTELSTIHRIATAEGTTYRVRRRLPLPDRKPAAKGGRTPRSHGTSSPATTLHIGDDKWQANPVLITHGYDRGGGRPPTPASTGSTRSFATAYAHMPKTPGGPNYHMAELDISCREGDRDQSRVPRLTNEEARNAATFASTNGSAYVCWMCRTYGHAMYACPFLSPEQRQFTAYRNYRYQMETRPGMRNLLQQSTRDDRGSRRSDPSRTGGGVRFAPREGWYRHPGTDKRDRRDPRRMDTSYTRPEGREERGRTPLSQGVQNAIMYLQGWAGDLNLQPAEEGGGEPVLPAPQILQRLDVATQGREVSDYFVEDVQPVV